MYNEGLSSDVDNMSKVVVVHLLSIKLLESSRNLLMRRLHQGNTIFVRRSIWMESPSSIVSLLLALSQANMK
jgi:hypothetical protein